MPITVKQERPYLDFGNCVYITNGIIELYATTDRGPRLIHLSMAGGENLFWADMGPAGTIRPEGLNLAFGKGDEYHILGGHRLWSAPEDPINTYYPDSDPVKVDLLPYGCLLTQPPQKGLNLQLSIEVRMDPGAPRVSVRHRIHNIGDRIVTLSPWAITQLASGGVEVIPQSKKETGLGPDRSFAVWPYTDMGDRRLTWADDYISVRPDDTERPLKIGTLNRRGYALYHNRGVVFKVMWNPLPKAEYPDFGCSYETYTNGHFIEFETLAPLTTLYAGQSATHEEEWLCFEEPEALNEMELIGKYGH